MPAETLECFLSSRKRLAICFEQLGNQWIEQWQFGEKPAHKLLLKSVSKDDENWPSSPPWQEVIKESHGGLPVIMAIGRAGRSHWSGSWSVLTTGVIAVEFACRVQNAPEFTGVTYQLASDAKIRQLNNDSINLEMDDESIRIRAGLDCSIDAENDGQIRIHPNNDGSGSFPRTLQWGYQID